MYSTIRIVFKYLSYYITASNGRGHGVHSPFVFEFITQVLNDDREFYTYCQVENVRKLLLSDTRELQITDFGAGSRVGHSNLQMVKEIARSSLKPAKFGQLLFRMVDHYAPVTILELGTSLGITTAYMAAARNGSRVITLEGTAAVAQTAKENFQKLDLHNIHLLEGNFDETLPSALTLTDTLDFVFIDGNHRYEPTLRYFRQLLPHLHEHSIVVVDDIHWSEEMEQAWEAVKSDAAVTLSIDLFFVGLAFFRKENREKQHFSIRF